MAPRRPLPAAVALALAWLAPVPVGSGPRPALEQSVLLSPAAGDMGRLERLRVERTRTVVLTLTDGDRLAVAEAAGRVRAAGLRVGYWIEVARCAELADRRPELMASLQGHGEWRRHFPTAPKPGPGEVVKCYPWVPVLSREGYAAQRDRVRGLLAGLPRPDEVYLNDLQGAPSACGCGNLRCRWTTDYGPVRTTADGGPESAARFVREVRRAAPGAEVVPVWTTECEEHEMAAAGECAGVGCYSGRCWFAWTEQLMPVVSEAPHLAVLATYRALGRNQARYGAEAAWVREAIGLFAAMPPKRKGKAVPATRMTAVVQGWDVTPSQRDAQVAQAEAAGARGVLIAEAPIDQAWQPRLHRAAK